ncbi:hypothetical protein FACS18949_06090 [Clostridia bacterium]|nr:hypothetical protein FACS189425_08260 [Clostridia bacterium]GHV33077.1 hypothetical protein FACS18949_06090 [Clostridia bacterium]
MEYIVDFAWDENAGVWTAICNEIPLALESNSFDALIEKVKICASEIGSLNASPSPSKLCIKSERWESIA